MSYFSRKKEKEIVEDKKVPESSSQPYRPKTKGYHSDIRDPLAPDL